MDGKGELIKVCDEVAADMERDSEAIDGKPFDGKTVAQYFGDQAAAIQALALVIRDVIIKTNKQK